jgi:hypothetical protein
MQSATIADKLIENGMWPLAALLCVIVLCLFFRGPITDLIKRFRTARLGNRTVEFSEATAEQQREVSASRPTLALPATMPPPEPLYASVEQEIEKTLAPLTPESQRAWLIRTVAMLRFRYGHEINYRLIFGSQLQLLLEANTPAGVQVARARAIYEQARTQYPNFYGEYTFEQWINFPMFVGLLQQTALSPDTNVVRITPVGATSCTTSSKPA